jgi:hypothetical protein
MEPAVERPLSGGDLSGGDLKRFNRLEPSPEDVSRGGPAADAKVGGQVGDVKTGGQAADVKTGGQVTKTGGQGDQDLRPDDRA